jgi:hypothetical protein
MKAQPACMAAVCAAMAFLGCAGQSGRGRPTEGRGECIVVEQVDCGPHNADVVVVAEVLIGQDGVGKVSRVLRVDPAGHPLREKAIAAATEPHHFEPGATSRVSEQTFPYCEHPSATVKRYGNCASQHVK